jgi:flavocytochrome c
MNLLSSRKFATLAQIMHFDIAIIGSGFAGLAAAIEAASSCDGKIVIVEKMSSPGGNSVMNAGQLAAVGSKYQLQDGIEDSVELMMKDMLKAGVDLNHPNLLEKMIAQSNDLVEWTESELGIEYRDRVTQLGGHSVPRTLGTLNASGNDIIDPMLRKVHAMPNIELLLDTAFATFVMTDDGKSVDGIRVFRDDQEQTLLCSKGVVLASGGFSADVKFRSIQNPSFGEGVMTTNQPGATAEVLKESLKIGAMSVQLSRIQLGPWTSPDEDGFGKAPLFCLGAGFPYGIIVNPDTSKRFVNELGNRYERSMAILQMGHPVVCIADSDGAKHSLEKNLEKLQLTVKAHMSVEEVAAEYGMDPSILSETIEEYNNGVKVGKDAFGKPLRADLGPIATFPFYSTRLWPKVHHCMGGLHINADAQVMHVDGHPISGLFAAGEVTGGVHGGDRLGSCATLDCLTFGRIAGHTAATLHPKDKKVLID